VRSIVVLTGRATHAPQAAGTSAFWRAVTVTLRRPMAWAGAPTWQGHPACWPPHDHVALWCRACSHGVQSWQTWSSPGAARGRESHPAQAEGGLPHDRDRVGRRHRRSADQANRISAPVSSHTNFVPLPIMSRCKLHNPYLDAAFQQRYPARTLATQRASPGKNVAGIGR
jgi:hypothetical protein